MTMGALTSASLSLLWFIVVAVTMTRLLHPALRRLIGIPLASCSYLFLCSSPEAFVAVVLFVLFGYVLLVLLARSNTSTNAFAAAIAMFGAFLCLKIPDVHYVIGYKLGWLDVKGIQAIGASYILFRHLHLLVDQHQGNFKSPNFLPYFSYMLLFSSVLAGPIARYPRFEESWKDIPPEEQIDCSGWIRILRGFLFATWASLFFQSWGDYARSVMSTRATSAPLVTFVIALYSYPFFLYLNFSGFTDIAIGSARLIGIRLPENFDHPFEARNVLEYWNRWHMSLSQWIRDYVFMTGYKSLAGRNAVWNMVIGQLLLLVSLIIMGVWHGFTRSYLAFGLLHGVAAMSCQGYGDLLQRCLGRKGLKSYMQNRLIKGMAVVLTFNFVSFSSLVFQLGDVHTLEFVRQTVSIVESRNGWLVALADPWTLLWVSLPSLSMAIVATTGASALVERCFQAFSERQPLSTIVFLSILVALLSTFGELLQIREPRLLYMQF